MADSVFAAFDRIVEEPEAEWGSLIAGAFPAGDKRRIELERMLSAWKSEPDFCISTVEIQRAIAGIESEATGRQSSPTIQGIEILERLGAGAAGTVYRGRQLGQINREVAVKVFSSQPDGIGHLKRECAALARLVHSNIAALYEVGQCEDGRVYAALELVRGAHLTSYLRQYNPDLSGTLRLFQQLCDAVAHANEFGVIHRDLKPANILVTQINAMPAIKVLDFSISRAASDEIAQTLTQNSIIAGTPEYMSPEQANPELGPCTTRSDVYALGVILYEILAGVNPYVPLGGPRPSVYSILQSIQCSDAIPVSRKRSQVAGAAWGQWKEVSLRGDLDAIVAKAMHPNPTHRYATARDLVADIQRHIAHEPIVATRGSLLRRITKLGRRHPVVTTTVSFAIVILIALVTFIGVAYQREVQAGIRESQSHARTRLALASSALNGGDLARAQQQLAEIPKEFRNSIWTILDAFCDQSLDAVRVDSQGIVDVWQSDRFAYVAGGSGKVWRIDISAPRIDPVLMSDRSRTLRRLAVTPDDATCYLLTDSGVEIWRDGRYIEAIELVDKNPGQLTFGRVMHEQTQLLNMDGDTFTLVNTPNGWEFESEDTLSNSPVDIGDTPYRACPADNGSIIFREAVTDRIVSRFEGHTRRAILPINLELFSHRRFVTGDSLGYVRLWEIPQDLIPILQGNAAVQLYNKGVVYSDGHSLEYPGGRESDIGLHEPSNAWHISGDCGGLMIRIGDSYVFAWDSSSKGPTSTSVALEREPTFQPAIDDDHGYLWLVDGSSRVRRIDLRSGDELRYELPTKPVSAMLPSKLGLLVACGTSLFVISEEVGVVVRDLSLGTQFIDIDTKGDRIVTSTHSGDGVMLDLGSGSSRSFQFGDSVHALEIVPTLDQVAVGQHDGTLVIYDLSSGNEMASLPVFDDPVSEIRMGTDGVLRLMSNGGQIHLLNLQSSE